MKKNEIKIGAIIKVPQEEDYGLVIKEDKKNYWVQWFKCLDGDKEGPEIYKYSKGSDHFIVATEEE